MPKRTKAQAAEAAELALFRLLRGDEAAWRGPALRAAVARALRAARATGEPDPAAAETPLYDGYAAELLALMQRQLSALHTRIVHATFACGPQHYSRWDNAERAGRTEKYRDQADACYGALARFLLQR